MTLPWSADTGIDRYEAWARVATLMGGNNRGSWFVPDVDDEVLVCRFFWELMSEGIYTNPVLAPAVAHSLVRISCMATHNDEHIERLLEAMHRIGRKMEIIQ